MTPLFENYTNTDVEEYVTKDLSVIRELLHPAFVSGLGMSLAEAVVEAGKHTAEHVHADFDEIYYCLEGRGALFINSEELKFAAGGFYLMRAGARHYLRAFTRLRLLCVCCPGYTHAGTKLL